MYTQKRICVHTWTKIFEDSITILMDFCVMCTNSVRRTNFDISKSNLDRVCDDVGITSS